MGIELKSPAQVSTDVIAALQLDEVAVDLASPEALAASLRRAAAFLCPTPPMALTRAVGEVLVGLLNLDEAVYSDIQDLLQALVGCGDLLELSREDEMNSRRQLFLGPPAFVRSTNSYFICGIRPDGAPLLSQELLDRTEYEGHLRLLHSVQFEHLDEALLEEGLIEIPEEHWIKAPRRSSPQDMLALYVDHLMAAGPAGRMDDVSILDPASKVSFYRGRWRHLKKTDNGHFVARRGQAYGAGLWCFAEVKSGEVTRILDLPIVSPLAPGWDEAWRLQAAIDATRGERQRIRWQSYGPTSPVVVDFFSPVPTWAQRRLDLQGTPVSRSRGALFSYRVRPSEIDRILRFFDELLWLQDENA